MAGPRLIDLQTDLKSLRYGSDKPYITKDINNPPSSNQTGMQITKRVDDLSRIAQMLIDRPGLKFIGNQALLQQVNIQDKLQKSRDKGKTLGGAIVQQALGTVKQTAKILGSTLAQVPVNGTGTHFVYAFRTDTYLQPSGGNQRSAFAQFFGAGGVEGAPLALQGKPITGKVDSNFGELNQQTGEFKVAVESELDYDEKINSLLPGESEYIKAKEGTTIIEDNVGIEGWKPYTSTGVKEQFVNRDTNQIVSQSKFTTSELSNKTRVKPSGSVVASTVATITNPFGGEPLDIPGIQTTATPGVITPQNLILGSTSNTNVTGSLTNPAEELGLKQPTTSSYKRETPYGKNSSNYLNGTAEFTTTGSIFYTGETGIKPETLPVNQTNSVTRENINSEIKSSAEDVEDKYNSQAKYYEQQKGRTIAGSEKNVIKELRVNLGDQGKVTFDRSAYSNTDPGTQDKLNLLDVSNTRIDGTSNARDLAKFYFEIITPDESRFLHFRAFIDSIDDNYNADWQGFKYVGRADSFYTYGGFERDINISFKIAAATRAEMKPLYRKMVYLASSTAPTYGGQGFMRGTLARMTIGSYFSQLPGVITSVKYNLIDDMPWEISMQSPEQGGDSDVQELPMGLQCSVSFKVIHDFAPQTGLFHYFTNPNPINAQDFLK